MTIGDKIKKIRTFRNMTQAELGATLGWGDKGANRLAQYETNYRVPRKDLVTEMAKILDVNPLALHEPTTMDASELMEILFWIDEFNPAAINLFQLETYPIEKCNSNEDTAVRYHDSDSWPAHPPVGMWFNYGVLNDFMKEWIIREYHREFYGEGQMFYTYKRLGANSMIRGEQEVTESEYILPLPSTEYNPN